MSDVPSSPTPDPAAEQELEVDLAAFLPEGIQVVADDGWGDEGPEPEIPAWARDERHGEGAAEPAGGDLQEPFRPTDAVTVQVPGPTATEPEEVDVSTLTAIEADLAEVDAAIAAIDAGDLTRSPLLAALLDSDQGPSSEGP